MQPGNGPLLHKNRFAGSFSIGYSEDGNGCINIAHKSFFRGGLGVAF